jgi:hypothetical protein
MISFGVDNIPTRRNVQLVYRRDEFAFDTDGPRPPECKAFITINEVQLEYGDDKLVLCVTGYCPYQGWLETKLSPPNYSSAGLRIIRPETVIPGVGIGINDLNSRWPVHANREGWVCLGDPSERGERAIEFAPSSVAVLRGDALVALWLRPLMQGG